LENPAPRHPSFNDEPGGTMTTADLLGKILQVVMGLAVFAAVVGLLIFFIDKAPKKGRDYWQLVGFLAPALIFVAIGLVYPAIRTSILAFQDSSGDWTLDNFVWTFTQPAAIRTLINTVIWVLLVPTFATAVGLAYAVFIDRSRGEKYYKSVLFMPIAISFVGASVIWKFVYEYRSGDREQIGLLNAIVVAFGGEPVQWLQTDPINTILLIVVMIWVQTGFAMVVLSAAIKGIATEQIEAAQLDGTNAWQRFTNVTIPGIRGALVVVLTTISIATLKVFDIVRTMTAGNFNTSIVANEMYTQAFRASEIGRGSALALILFVLVLPIVIYNVNVLRKQREIR
jgi:alpha-glucoside transport system permease protein